MATAAASRLSGPVVWIPSYRSPSPTRVKLASGSGARSPGKSVIVSSPSSATAKSCRPCMCSPTNHLGSFRCSLHKERKQEGAAGNSKPAPAPSVSPPVSIGGGTCRLGAKRMGSPLVRVGGAVESGTWARRALAPPPQSPRRRRAAGEFHPRPSRLSAVSFAGDRAGDSSQ